MITSRIIRRVSPSLVVSCLALLIALGGVGYAATSLPANSVGAKQLKRSAVTGAKIRSNAVTGAKVRDDSLTGADISEATLGEVPSATHADVAASAATAASAGTATHAASADVATTASTAGHATSADSAANAAALGGFAAANYMLSFGGGAEAGGDPFSALGGDGTSLLVGFTGTNVGQVKMACSDPATSLSVQYENSRDDVERVWSEPAGGSATLYSLGTSASTSSSGAAHVTYFIEFGGTKMARVDVWTGLDGGTNSCFGYLDELILPFTP